MRTVNAISGKPWGPMLRSETAETGAAGRPAPGRAVVPVEPARPPELPRPINRRPLAAFLVQLIATELQAPQTRARRCVAPAEAIRRYQTALAGTPSANGNILSRAA